MPVLTCNMQHIILVVHSTKCLALSVCMCTICMHVLNLYECVYYLVRVRCMSLAGNGVMSFFPGKYCWVRSGVYNYTWVPISSLKSLLPWITQQCKLLCSHGSLCRQPNQSSWAELAVEASSDLLSIGYVQSFIIILTISCWLCGWVHESAQTNSSSLMCSPPLGFRGWSKQVGEGCQTRYE